MLAGVALVATIEPSVTRRLRIYPEISTSLVPLSSDLISTA